MASARVFAFALVAYGCSPFGGGGAFICTDDTSCSGGTGGGRCEANGYCSFPDARCGDGDGDGRSYGSESGGLAGVCVGSEPPVDARVFEDAATEERDAPGPEAGEVCYGDANGYVRPCFAMPPSGATQLTAAIDTNPGSADCATNVSNTTACVIAAASITIPLGATVTVTGARPLVLVATQTIEIAGTLDASSRRQPERIGANANPTDCPAATAVGARAGGAGGTLGGEGGDGGDGAGDGGDAASVVAITALRGGCHGSEGKNGANGTGGLAGKGGGAIYLIASTITVAATGSINASGAGGSAGQAGDAGGGGGGAGGFIGLDAPSLANAGVIFANGGGGGEGSGNQTAGTPGADPAGIAAAPGGNGGSNGLPGGAGGAGNTAAGDGTDAPADYGAGGGGGGVGVIRVFRGTLGGIVSPPPT